MVQKTKKANLLNWYINFSFYRDLVNLPAKEKQQLDKEVYRNYFRPSERLVVVEKSPNSYTGWKPVKQESPYEDQMLIQLARKTQYFFEKEVIPLDRSDEWPVIITLKHVTEDNGTISSNPYDYSTGLLFQFFEASNTGGSWFSSSNIYSLDPILVAQIVIIDSLNASLRPCFHQCRDPDCKQWFFNPRKKEQLYCSKKCLWRHRAKSTTEADKKEYLRKQRFWMKLKGLVEKNLSDEEFELLWLEYLKKPSHKLESNEITEWFEWGRNNYRN